MIEKNIKDRIPTYPGRVQLTPVDGQPNVYEMTRADEPIEEGTPINKATLESFVKSRLTGRFYTLNVTHTLDTVATSTYSMDVYANEFTADGMPSTWDVGQRILIETPTMTAYAVSANTFMGMKCNTILQPSKRYELVYNGNSFDVREV